jgi:hypothetical protein
MYLALDFSWGCREAISFTRGEKAGLRFNRFRLKAGLHTWV